MSNQPTAQVPLDVLEALIDATAEVSQQRACYNNWPTSPKGQAWARTRAHLTIAERILERAPRQKQCS